MNEEKTKSFPVSKRMVYDSYLKVMSKNGCAGIDGQSIKMFEADMSKNLYEIYNRMASGSYFPPPVRTEFIPSLEIWNKQRLDNKGRMMGDYHVRFREGLGLKCPCLLDFNKKKVNDAYPNIKLN